MEERLGVIQFQGRPTAVRLSGPLHEGEYFTAHGPPLATLHSKRASYVHSAQQYNRAVSNCDIQCPWLLFLYLNIKGNLQYHFLDEKGFKEIIHSIKKCINGHG